jgi:uroporphyrinogen decarboxylase
MENFFMKGMTSRERVRTALDHREPDRVPLDLTTTIGAYTKLVKYLGLESIVDAEPKTNRWETYVPIDQKVMEVLNIDIAHLRVQTPSGYPVELSDGAIVDEWGVKRKRFERPGGGFYWEMVENPLKEASIKSLDDYPWPNFRDPYVIEGFEENVRWWYENTNYAIEVRLETGGLGEQAGFLRGIEQWWMDLVTEPEFAMSLMNKLCDIAIESSKIGIEIVGKYADIIRFTGWDLGGQNGPIFSPAMVDKMFKPILKRLWGTVIELLHKANPRAKIFFHTCGGVYPLIPILIESGLDILDPLQTTAAGMDMVKIKKEFGDKLTFHGAMDIQRVLPFSTVDQIKEEVKLRIKQLAPGGGFILAPTHALQDDTPPENIVAMYQAGKEYGRYPINL